MPIVNCQVCDKEKSIIPARLKTFRFCSYACRGKWRQDHFKGPNNPAWQDGPREKRCQHCGIEFQWDGVKPYSSFVKQKFCCKSCADAGGFRFKGEEHWNFKQDARRRSRSAKHHAWANAVISRDHATCQQCGAKYAELHAHHVKSHKEYPALRYEVGNGLTLCYRCHWAIHTAQNDNGVNSGEALAGKAEGNPEPSPSGNIREGVTTRGRAYRRWEGRCDWCNAFLSKRLSDAKGKQFHFCNYVCSGKHRAKYGGAFGRPRQ